MKKCCFMFHACPLRVKYNCSACVKSSIILWFVPSLKREEGGIEEESKCKVKLQHLPWGCITWKMDFQWQFFLGCEQRNQLQCRKKQYGDLCDNSAEIWEVTMSALSMSNMALTRGFGREIILMLEGNKCSWSCT